MAGRLGARSHLRAGKQETLRYWPSAARWPRFVCAGCSAVENERILFRRSVDAPGQSLSQHQRGGIGWRRVPAFQRKSIPYNGRGRSGYNKGISPAGRQSLIRRDRVILVVGRGAAGNDQRRGLPGP